MRQVPSDPELKAIESALGALVPVSSRLDRDKLMFQAGAVSTPAARRRWVWPVITSVLSVALAGESLVLGLRRSPQIVERIVFMPAPTRSDRPENTPAESAPGRERPAVESVALGSDFQRFQDLVMRFGLDALSGPPSVASRSDGGELPEGPEPRPAGALRTLELQRILKPGDPS